MMEIVKIQADNRTGHGKSPSARLRRGGKIPAVAYGKGLATVHLAIAPKDLMTVLRSEHGRNAVVELDVGGERKITALVRDYAYHPVTRDLTHVDFVEVKLDQLVDVEVPFTTSGKAAGITAGGVLRIVYRSLPIRALPERIPVSIDHDITELGLNEAVKASQVKLPEGVSIRLPEDQTIAAIVAPEKDRSEEAAPAAGAAAAAAPATAAAAGKPGAAAPAAAAAAKAAPAAKDAKKKLAAGAP